MSGEYDEEIKAKAANYLVDKIHMIYREGSDADKHYAEFAQIMRNLTASDPLIENLLRNYGLTGEQLRESVTSKKKDNKAITPSNIYLQRRGGNVFEDFVQKVLDGIVVKNGGVSFNTGGFNNMKADHTITYGISNGESLLQEIYKDLTIDDDSKRLKNIELLGKFFD